MLWNPSIRLIHCSFCYIILYDMIEQTSLAKGSKNSGVKPDIHYKNPVVVLIAHLYPGCRQSEEAVVTYENFTRD